MPLDDLAISIAHRHTNNGWARLFGNNKLGITRGAESCHVAKTGKADIAGINDGAVAISKLDAAAVVDLDAVEKSGVPVLVNALRRNDDAIAILVQHQALVRGCQHTLRVDQERAIAGVGDAAIILVGGDEHADTTDSHIQRIVGDFQSALLVVRAAGHLMDDTKSDILAGNRNILGVGMKEIAVTPFEPCRSGIGNIVGDNIELGCGHLQSITNGRNHGALV